MNGHDWLGYTVLLYDVSGVSRIFSYKSKISESSDLPVYKQQAHTEHYPYTFAFIIFTELSFEVSLIMKLGKNIRTLQAQL